MTAVLPDPGETLQVRIEWAPGTCGREPWQGVLFGALNQYGYPVYFTADGGTITPSDIEMGAVTITPLASPRTRSEASAELRRVVADMEVPTFAGEPEWYSAATLCGYLQHALACDVEDRTLHRQLAAAEWPRRFPDGPSWESLPDNLQAAVERAQDALVCDLINIGAVPEVGNGLIDSDGVAAFIATMSPALALLIADLLDGRGDPDRIATAVLDPNAESLMEPTRMTDCTPVAYVSTAPDVLAAFAANQRDREAYAQLLRDRSAALPGYAGLRTRVFIGSATVVGIDVTDPDNPPEGWVYRKGHGCHVPKPGKSGDAAQAWLESVAATPKGAARVLEDVGAPSSVTYPSDRRDGTSTISSGQVLVTADAVHVLYEAEPTDARTGLFSRAGVPDDRWTREPLSAYYGAREAVEAAPDHVVCDCPCAECVDSHCPSCVVGQRSTQTAQEARRG